MSEEKKSGSESSSGSSSSSSGSESESGSASEEKTKVSKSLFESDNSDNERVKDTRLYEDSDDDEEGQEDEDDTEGEEDVKPSKKQSLKEIKKSMASNPDLYGVRRSARSRKEPTRYTEHGSDSDSDRPKRRGRRRKSADNWEGKSDESSEQSSESDSYQPSRYINKRATAPRLKGRRAGRPAGRKKRAPSYSDTDDDASKRTSLRATTKGVSYKEDSDGKTDSDDIIEPTEKEIKEQEEQELKESIDRVLEHRQGNPDAFGGKTTIYNIEENGDPNTPSTDKILQYLIKWKGWSYIHATWETDESLINKVNGIKRVENYKKRQDEIDSWKMSATPEEIEYFDCQNEMMSDLVRYYIIADRIIDHSNAKGVIHPDYLVKWQGLPYAECTWESGDLITKRFQTQVDEYHARNKSHTIPNKLCKVLKVRPKFQPLTEQPDYIGERDKYELRDYQLEGLNWLIQSWSKYNSVILADEMGLGKTIQVISFLSALANTYQLYGPFLIVVPLSTVVAWQREFTIWAPEMNVVTYLGDLGSRNKIREYEFHQPGNKRIKFNALITTYEILLKDKTQLGSFQWAMLVVDEAHRLKNDDSLLYRCLVEFNSNHRLLITGTPLQNSLKELWSLLHFIMPDKFDSWDEFEERHSKAESQGFSGLHKELQPFLLRRVKKDVEKSLPSKTEQILRVEMSSIQKEYSRLILAKNYKALSKGVKGSITGFINIMMELKKCCNHAFITRPQDNIYVTPSDRLQAYIRGSGKMLLLDKLLVRLKDTGHRVLIFSQMVRMLDIIAEYLKLKHFQFQRLDGSIRGDIRKQALDHFNAEGSQDFCFLLSTRAGGLGVNLATADTVIIFDSDWNPQNDLQAQARAHRIGQKNQVSVYRLVCKNSVEETIVERAKRKMVLDHLVIQRMDTTGRTILNRDKSSNNTPFNKEELTSILKFGAADLFKEGGGDDEDPQVDIDDILMRAETRETESSMVDDDLLSNFKVVSFDNLEEEDNRKQMNIDEDSVDKDWDSIIPEDTRRKVDEEDKQKQMLELHLPPRSRKTIQQLEKEYDSDGDKKSSRRRDDYDEDSSSSGGGEDEEEERPKKRGRGKASREAGAFTSMEVRKFIKSYKKFANPLARLDAIAGDAELQEKSEAELRGLAELIKSRCEETMRVYRAQQEDEQPVDGKKGPTRGPTFKIANVTVNAATLAKTMDDMSPLAYLPVDKDERKKYTLNCVVKDAHWDCEWEIDDDTNLVRGVYEYGMGSWEQIKMDTQFNLHDKILPGTATKPQAKHLQTRMDYLLKILKKVSLNEDDKSQQPKKERRKRPPKQKSTENATVNNGDISNNLGDDSSIQDTARKKKSKKKVEKSAEFVDSPLSEDENDENVNKNKKNNDAKRKSSSSKKKKSEALHLTAGSEPVPVGKDEQTLSSAVFAQCKEQMRPVKKALKQLDNPEEDLSGKETIHHIMQCLLTIGDRITHCLGKLTEPDDIKLLRNNLWVFVSHFTDFDPSRLHKMYKHAIRKRDDKKSHKKDVSETKSEKSEKRESKNNDEGVEKKEEHHHKRHGHGSPKKEEHRKEHQSKRSSKSSSHHHHKDTPSSSTPRSGSTHNSQHRSTNNTSPSDRWTHSSPLVRAEEQQTIRFNNNSSSKSSFRKYRNEPSQISHSEYNHSYQRYNHERSRDPRTEPHPYNRKDTEPHQYNRKDPRDYRYPEPTYPQYPPPPGVEYWQPEPMMAYAAPPGYSDYDRYPPQAPGDPRKRKMDNHDRNVPKHHKAQNDTQQYPH